MNLFEKVKSKLKITFKKPSTLTLPAAEIIKSEDYYKNESDYDMPPKLFVESEKNLHCRKKKRSKRTITARSPSNTTIQELYNRDFSWIDKNFEKGFGDSRPGIEYDKDEQRIDPAYNGDSRNGSFKDQNETDFDSMDDFDEKPSVKNVSSTKIVPPSEPQQLPPPPNHKKYRYKKIIIPKKEISTLLKDDDDQAGNKPKKFYYYKPSSTEKLYQLDPRTLAAKVSEIIDDRTLKEMLTIPREYFTGNREKTRSRNISFGFNFLCKKRKYLRGKKFKTRMKEYEDGSRNGHDGGGRAVNDELAYKNSTTYFPIQRSGISWHKIPISRNEFKNLANDNDFEGVDKEHFSRPLEHSRRDIHRNKGILKNVPHLGPEQARPSQNLNEKLNHFPRRFPVKNNIGISSPYQSSHLITKQSIDVLKKSEFNQKVPAVSKTFDLDLDVILNRHLSTESRKIIHGLESQSTTTRYDTQADKDNQSMGDGIIIVEKQRYGSNSYV